MASVSRSFQPMAPPRYRPVEPRPAPICFPSEIEPEKRPMEKKWHHLVRNLFFELLRVAFGDQVLLAINQFLYWNASDSADKLAPDLCATPERRDRHLDSWKTWELGAPAFVLEVVSKASWPADVVDKPALYDRIGVGEYVVFDPEYGKRAPAGGHEPRLLRAWRRVDGVLCELELDEPDRYFCEVLGLWARSCPSDDPAAEGRPALRLARGERGAELLPTHEERARRQQVELDALRKELARLKGTE